MKFYLSVIVAFLVMTNVAWGAVGDGGVSDGSSYNKPDQNYLAGTALQSTELFVVWSRDRFPKCFDALPEWFVPEQQSSAQGNRLAKIRNYPQAQKWPHIPHPRSVDLIRRDCQLKS